MRTRYIEGEVVAKAETDLAFCCSFAWTDENYVGSNVWIPRSVIHCEYLHHIDDACEGDVITIAVAEWWLKKNL